MATSDYLICQFKKNNNNLRGDLRTLSTNASSGINSADSFHVVKEEVFQKSTIDH